MSKCKYKAEDGECRYEKHFPYKEYCMDGPCTRYTPATNADRIRQMGDEELAEFITYKQGLRPHHEHFEGTKLLWLEWLKEEADADR